jgi:hypothetical protein
MRALAVLAAVCVVAIAAGAALAVGKSARVTAAAAEEVINACRHPNGGCVRTRLMRPGAAGRGRGETEETMRYRGQPGLAAMRNSTGAV